MNNGYTKNIRKEFKLNQTSLNNKLRFIKIKMNSYLSRHGVYTNIGVRLTDKIFYLRKVLDIQPHRISKKEGIEWLISCWENSSNEVIRKNDPLNFYLSTAWRIMRMKVLHHYGAKCMRCGDIENLEVDHIKPRSLYPELELYFANLQVLCCFCNASKGNRFIVDYRPILNLKTD